MLEEMNSKKPSAEYVLNFAFYSFVGFIAIQAGFAILANSESMLADCEAMAVDAMTYLFNLCAERIKNKPLTEEEKRAARGEAARTQGSAASVVGVGSSNHFGHLLDRHCDIDIE